LSEHIKIANDPINRNMLESSLNIAAGDDALGAPLITFGFV
jgi:hypothetical protein